MPSETTVLGLREDLLRRSLENMTCYFAGKDDDDGMAENGVAGDAKWIKHDATPNTLFCDRLHGTVPKCHTTSHALSITCPKVMRIMIMP